MSYNNILIENKEQVQYITINRPKQLNALNKETIEELSSAMSLAEKDALVGVIILTGSGEKSFVAGADIKEFADFDSEKGKSLSKVGHDSLFNLMANSVVFPDQYNY